MDWLNYNHLYYFWVVAREGSIARASEQLDVAPPTISAQIRALERSLGEKLFSRVGRNLALTEVGRMVLQHADDMFMSARDLLDTLKGRPTGRPLRLVIGVADALPKLVAYRLIRPALELPEAVHFTCVEGRPERLMAELAVHGLDVVLADAPLGPQVKVRAFNHHLGGSAVMIFGTAELAAAHRRDFPRSLDGAPFLLPTPTTALRRSLDQWFESEGIRPVVRGELDDSALMMVFGESGKGLFAAPAVVEAEVRRKYGVRAVGRVEAVQEQFYAISVERKLKHPAVVAISEAARRDLFA